MNVIHGDLEETKMNVKLNFCMYFIKILCVGSLLSIFGYWSYKAFAKFISRPISSSVSYLNGDDGHGNIGKNSKWLTNGDVIYI